VSKLKEDKTYCLERTAENEPDPEEEEKSKEII